MPEVKILLCDDDPDLQGLLVRRLKKMGIEPDAAGDGRVAKGFVDENDYDVIVTDIYMPEATGLEVMEYAKQKDSDTQVVIITSSATLDNAIDALNHGAFGYLTKPFPVSGMDMGQYFYPLPGNLCSQRCVLWGK